MPGKDNKGGRMKKRVFVYGKTATEPMPYPEVLSKKKLAFLKSCSRYDSTVEKDFNLENREQI